MKVYYSDLKHAGEFESRAPNGLRFDWKKSWEGTGATKSAAAKVGLNAGKVLARRLD